MGAAPAGSQDGTAVVVLDGFTVFGWIVLLARSQGSKDAEIKVPSAKTEADDRDLRPGPAAPATEPAYVVMAAQQERRGDVEVAGGVSGRCAGRTRDKTAYRISVRRG